MAIARKPFFDSLNPFKRGPSRSTVKDWLLSGDHTALCENTVLYRGAVLSAATNLVSTLGGEPMRVRDRAAKFLLTTARSGEDLSEVADILAPIVRRELDADIRSTIILALRTSFNADPVSREKILRAVPDLRTLQLD